MAALDPLPHCERSSADYDRPSHPLQQRGRRRPTEERRHSDRRNGKLGFPKRGLGFGYLVAIVQDTQETGWQIPRLQLRLVRSLRLSGMDQSEATTRHDLNDPELSQRGSAGFRGRSRPGQTQSIRNRETALLKSLNLPEEKLVDWIRRPGQPLTRGQDTAVWLKNEGVQWRPGR